MLVVFETMMKKTLELFIYSEFYDLFSLCS